MGHARARGRACGATFLLRRDPICATIPTMTTTADPLSSTFDVLDLSLGAPPSAQPWAIGRALRGADIELLAQPQGCTAGAVKRLRESHHGLARLLATGMKQVEVSAITGFSQSRISILKADPAFAELVEHYREVSDSAFADVRGQIAAMGADALAELRDRLHDTPEGFKTRELMDMVNSMLDRSGHSPVTRHVVGTVALSGDALAQLKQIAKEAQCGHVTTDLTPAREEALPRDQGPSLGGAEPTGAGLREETTEGQPSEGDHL